MGFTSMVFVPPQVVTPKAQELHQEARALYEGVDATMEPGVSAQHKIMMDRLELDSKRSGPGCQFIVAPGVMALPGTSHCHCCALIVMLIAVHSYLLRRNEICIHQPDNELPMVSWCCGTLTTSSEAFCGLMISLS